MAIDVGIELVGQGEDLAHGTGILPGLVAGGNFFLLAAELRVKFLIFSQARGETAGKMLFDETRSPRRQVDYLAHQVAVALEDEVLEIEVEIFDMAVQLAGKVVAQEFRVEAIEILPHGNGGAPGFAHLGAVDGKVPVGKNAGGQPVAGALEHGRPKEGMKIDDVFADEVIELRLGRGTPEFGKIPPMLLAPVPGGGHVAG